MNPIVFVGAKLDKDLREWSITLLNEFKDVFAWSYEDMPGLNTDIVVHRLLLRPECKPVKQKRYVWNASGTWKSKNKLSSNQKPLGNRLPSMVSRYSADNQGDEKLITCIDYRDLNKASRNNNFSLLNIDGLVDNSVAHALFSFMNSFLDYNKIRMAPKDRAKTSFITLRVPSGTRSYPLGLIM